VVFLHFLPLACFFFFFVLSGIPHGYGAQTQGNGPVVIPTGFWQSLFAFLSILSDPRLK
jgi:hypothetical protein